MDMLRQALATRLPFVHVTTDDLIHITEVLSAIAGEEVRPLDPGDIGSGAGFPDGNIFYTSTDIASPSLYLTCKSKGKCLVFVNTKKSVLHFDGGEMFPPKELLRSFLLDILKDKKKVEKVMPAYGGLTLKDAYEVTALTLKRAGFASAQGLNETRQGYISKLKGITQIDTQFPYYQCPSQLMGWINENLPFFTKTFAPELVPRGLLFDGPPGTGKTMGAKYLAQVLGVPLYHLDVGAMKGKYVGDSEGNLHAALTQVDQVEPCVVLLDEVEKIFTEQHDSGVTSSLLSTLLFWLQEHKTKVFTVMTTNKISNIPPELYRPGRIDATMVFKGLESHSQAMTFACEVFKSTAAKVWGVSPKKPKVLDEAYVAQELKIMFAEKSCVPQVRVATLVNHVIKRIVLEEQ